MEKSQQTTQEIQKIIKDCYEHLHANKMDNLEEMDKFLEKYNLPKLSSVTQSSPTLCNPMDYSKPGFPVHHQLLELAQIHIH